jgi:uncharacterized protein (UPF0332 family)
MALKKAIRNLDSAAHLLALGDLDNAVSLIYNGSEGIRRL